MGDRPILFSAAMIRAILAGSKTQTRRVAHEDKGMFWGHRGYRPVYSPQTGDVRFHHIETNEPSQFSPVIRCPYGKPGDRLWVRENFYLSPPCFTDNDNDCNIRDEHGEGRIISYSATAKPGAIEAAKDYRIRQRPSIHMPRWASRITLQITGVRVERVQDISEWDAIQEGWDPSGIEAVRPKRWFEDLWDSINAKRGHSWAANPWVWVVSFEVVKDAER